MSNPRNTPSPSSDCLTDSDIDSGAEEINLDQELSLELTETTVVSESESLPDSSESLPESPLSDQEKPEKSEESSKQTKSPSSSGSKKISEELKEALRLIEEESTHEGKLQLIIENMKKSLAQKGNPQFKMFWELRRLCLPLFKEKIHPPLRLQLWNDFSELSKEARELKDILDEQSSFAAEQIDLAITSLEDDLKNLDLVLKKTTAPTFPLTCKLLDKKKDIFVIQQKKITLLSAFATRVNGLRKELVRTGMRVRQKNKLFERLSKLGDSVFPERKNLIKEISQSFSADIDAFVVQHFSEGVPKGTLYLLRDEIKALQGIAKILTLNTQAFSHTRTRLSECWDQIRELEKDRKKERNQKRTEFKENQEAIQQKIDGFTKAYKEESLNNTEGHKVLDDILTEMRDIELGRDEVKILKSNISKARSLIRSQEQKVEDERKQKELERNKLKSDQFAELEKRVNDLCEGSEDLSIDEINSQRDTLQQDIKDASLLHSGDKKKLEKALRILKNVVSEKQEQALMNMPSADKEGLDKLRQLLTQRLTQKREIRDRLEKYRKEKGSSSLDFEKALAFNDKIEEAKELLAQVVIRIKELEDKISELKP